MIDEKAIITELRKYERKKFSCAIIVDPTISSSVDPYVNDLCLKLVGTLYQRSLTHKFIEYVIEPPTLKEFLWRKRRKITIKVDALEVLKDFVPPEPKKYQYMYDALIVDDLVEEPK